MRVLEGLCLSLGDKANDLWWQMLATSVDFLKGEGVTRCSLVFSGDDGGFGCGREWCFVERLVYTLYIL